MYAVTFALADESRDFRKLFTPVPGQADASVLRGLIHGRPLVVGHIGVGPAAAALGIHSLLTHTRPELLVCAGYGGALDPALRVGDVVLDLRGAPAAWHPRSMPAGVRVGKIHTQSDAAESVHEKRTLFMETGASVVDMETAAVAAACAAAGVPLLGVRVISDAATQPLPVPMAHWFDLHRQRPRPLALVCYLAKHPSKIAPFTRFVRGLSGARAALAACLSDLLADFAQNRPTDF